MDWYADWQSAFTERLSEIGTAFLEFLPNLTGAVLLLLLGWVVARILRTLGVRLAHLFNGMLQRVSPARTEAMARPALVETLGSIIFWIVILLFVTAATHVLGLDAFAAWLNRVVAYIPMLLVGGLIILAGFLVSFLVRDLVSATAPGGAQQARLLGQLAQAAILVTAIVIGADQIGINVTFLIVLAGIVFATLLGGLCLAVSLGARDFVRNLIAVHNARQTYRPGDRIRIADHEGRILEFTHTAVLLETREGRLLLPGRWFNAEPSLLLGSEAGRE